MQAQTSTPRNPVQVQLLGLPFNYFYTMEFIIYNSIDKQGREKISIGSPRYMQERIKISKQLVRYLGWNMEEADFEEMKSWDNQKLYNVLMATMEKNELYVFYPN